MQKINATLVPLAPAAPPKINATIVPLAPSVAPGAPKGFLRRAADAGADAYKDYAQGAYDLGAGALHGALSGIAPIGQMIAAHPDLASFLGMPQMERQPASAALQKLSAAALPGSKPSSVMYQAGAMAGNVLPFMGAGAGAEAARGAAESLPLIGKAAAWLGKEGLPSVAKRALGAAAYGAAQTPKRPVSGAVLGGVTAPLTELGVSGVKNLPAFGINALKKYVREGAKFTPEQTKKILGSTDSPLTVFDVTGNQRGQQTVNEGIIGSSPFSGAAKRILANVNDLTAKTNDFADSLNPDNTNADEYVRQQILDNYNANQQQKTANYNAIGEKADAAGFMIPSFPKAEGYANEILGKMGTYKKMRGASRKLSKDTLEQFSDLVDPEKTGSAGIGMPMNEATVQHGIYEDLANQLDMHQNKYESGKIKRLRQLHIQDTEDALKNPANFNLSPELAKQAADNLSTDWKKASAYYANNIVPYDYGNLVGQMETNPNINKEPILKIFANGKNPVIFNQLSPKAKNLVRAKFLLKKAEGKGPGDEENMNAASIYTNYKNMSPGEKQLLLTPEIENRVKTLKALHNANAENITASGLPKTGRNLLKYVAKTGHGGPAALLAGGGFLLGHPALAATAGLVLGAAHILGARAFSKKIADRAFIDRLLNEAPQGYRAGQGIAQKALIANILNRGQTQ